MKHLRPSCIVLLALASILTIAGCGGVTTQPHGASATSIFVAQNNIPIVDNPPQIGLGQVLQFPTNASGDPSPTTTITFAAPATITAIATDASGNIYVASTTDLRAYAPGSTGTAAPTRLIPANATTTLGSVTALTVDASGNIYAAEVNSSANASGIAVFSSSANGSVAPTRYILGALQAPGNLSTLQTPSALATDSSGNLYVLDTAAGGASTDNIDVFGPTATGNVAPIRTIGGPQVGYVRSIAIDSADDLYTANNLGAGSIYEYSNGAKGNATPKRSITQAGVLSSVTVDTAGNVYTVYLSSMLNNVIGPPQIMTFPPTASGVARPKSQFTPFRLETEEVTSVLVTQVAVN